MKFLSLLLAPTVALCGTFSGTVVSLDGIPVVGATIKAGKDSVTTATDGSWVLARAAGIASRSGKTISVTSHLTVENGHPRISFGGMDIRGRSRASGSPADAMRSSRDNKGPATAAARSSAERDTLRVHWKGKRLTVLSVPSDTGSITFRIDTAWKDDAGIPWNPRIAYGSLLDARDGQTYRTVAIRTQTWMAENLSYRSQSKDSGIVYKNLPSNEPKYGRLYSWASAMALNDTCDRKICSTQVHTRHTGICPTGWRVPRYKEFDSLSFDSTLPTKWDDDRIRSAVGWLNFPLTKETDRFGFRAVPAGADFESFDLERLYAYFWSSDETGANSATFKYIHNGVFFVNRYNFYKSHAFSVRCVKDAP